MKPLDVVFCPCIPSELRISEKQLSKNSFDRQRKSSLSKKKVNEIDNMGKENHMRELPSPDFISAMAGSDRASAEMKSELLIARSTAQISVVWHRRWAQNFPVSELGISQKRLKNTNTKNNISTADEQCFCWLLIEQQSKKRHEILGFPNWVLNNCW